MRAEEMNRIGYEIIGAVYEVRKVLGQFLYENKYEAALAYELTQKGYRVERQHPIDIIYKDILLDDAMRVDLLVEGCIPVELKSLPFMGSREVNQILTYMSFGRYSLGYLINFGVDEFVAKRYASEFPMYGGIYRFVNSFPCK